MNDKPMQDLHPDKVPPALTQYFFQENEAFAYISDMVLTPLLEKPQEQDKALRIWIANCGTGEEAYLLALFIITTLGIEISQWNIKIFATDADMDALTYGRQGIYPRSLLNNVPEQYHNFFFEQVEQGYRPIKIVRQKLIFGQNDLCHNAPFPDINLVICLHPFQKYSSASLHQIFTQFAFSLYPDGLLFLGNEKTDNPPPNDYEQIDAQWQLYRPIRNLLSTGFHSRRRRTSAYLPSTQKRHQEIHETGIMLSAYEAVQRQQLQTLSIQTIPAGIVIINMAYHMLATNNTARQMLGIDEEQSIDDFLHAVPGLPYIRARIAIDTVFQKHETLALPEVELDKSRGGNGHCLNLMLGFLPNETVPEEVVIITISDVSNLILEARQSRYTQIFQTQQLQEQQSINIQLRNTNEELLASNRALREANNKLHITNGELLRMCKMLQNTVEEFEITNEELMMSYEELQTTSAEFDLLLSAANEELRALQKDLKSSIQEQYINIIATNQLSQDPSCTNS